MPKKVKAAEPLSETTIEAPTEEDIKNVINLANNPAELIKKIKEYKKELKEVKKIAASKLKMLREAEEMLFDLK